MVKLGKSDTESAVKVVRRIAPRFAGFDEVKLKEGKKDRAVQEVFICEIPFLLINFRWRSLKKNGIESILALGKRIHELVKMICQSQIT